jgi:hypothetical protein
MKKVIIAFDGNHFSKGAFDFAERLNQSQKILLVGAFLPQVNFASLTNYPGGGIDGPWLTPVIESNDPAVMEECVAIFTEHCNKCQIEFRVHKDFHEFSLAELKKESRFADLLIFGSEAFYENIGTDEPNIYLREALHDVECPAVVVPEDFDFPENNILAYDGSESSVFAIKQFAYLFPELSSNKTILVFAKAKNGEEMPDQDYIEELAARHFSNLTLEKLQINPAKYFDTWLLENQKAIFVSGSFGRSDISRLIRKSFAIDMLKDHRIPVFIAHK